MIDWGRRYLMCPPDHFGVAYEINPWMHREVDADTSRARAQHAALVDTLREVGASVELMEPVAGLPDLVFTANAGIVDGRRFVPARFRHPERQGEEPHDRTWFESNGFEIAELPGPDPFEGAGDALPFRRRLLAGYRTRSQIPALTAVSDVLGVEVLPVELVDERFYHVDLTFCPLDDDHAMCVPDAWDRYGREVVRALVPSPLDLTLEEGLTFCANSVVVGRTVVMPSCPDRVRAQLTEWGFEVVVCPVDEFLKAGGGVRCLTLALDMVLT